MRPQPVDLDMDRVRQRRFRHRRAGADDLAKTRVLGDLPTDRNVMRRHSAIGGLRLGRQPRPDDEPVRPRLARGDPERERIARERRPRQQAGRTQSSEQR